MNALKQHFAHRRRSLYVTVGLGMAVLAGTGGYLATSALSAGSTGSAATAATINSALSSTANPAASSPPAKSRSRHQGASALQRLRRLGGMYGEVAYHGKDGTKTLAFERGTVTSASGDLVVKAANGTTWNWKYASDTVVRDGGKKGSRSDLSAGEHVLVAGQVTSGNHDARVIIVAKPKAKGSGSGSTPSAAPSSSAGTSSS
ncbi:MAG TPA: hypothetical protein VH089_26580 [Streptosporangiaceae bacterium]|jgi:hypothetical protein|nr:hypothetical protein [Streptosporangiaceae bacterium]